MSKERPWEDLPDLFRMIDEMKADGMSDEDAAAYLKALDNEAFAEEDLAMEMAGVPEDVRRGLWEAFDSFGDYDPDDAEGE